MGSLSLLQGDLPNPGIELRSPELQVDSLPAEPQVRGTFIMHVAFYSSVLFSFLVLINYLAIPGLCGCAGFSLVAASRGCSSAVV